MATWNYALVIPVWILLTVFPAVDGKQNITLVNNGTLFAYGTDEGDRTTGSNPAPGGGVDLSAEKYVQEKGIKFFGSKRKNLFVSNHGLITFTVQHPAYVTAEKMLESQRYVSSIFGLNVDADWRTTVDKGFIYYRVITKASERQRGQKGLAVTVSLDDLSAEIRRGMVGASKFNAEYGCVVTWEDLADKNAIKACSRNLNDINCQTDTFQVVLLTDGTKTYVIMNYKKVGLKIKVGKNFNEFAGFYGREWNVLVPVTPGDTYDPNELEALQGSETKGRYLFRVDGYEIVRGGCRAGSSSEELTISPTYASMLGGIWIEMSGPCISDQQKNQLRCKFHDKVVEAHAMSGAKVRCQAPMLMTRDTIKLTLSVNGGKNFDFSSDFTILSPEEHGGYVTVSKIADKNDSPVLKLGKPLTLIWTHALLGDKAKDVNINIIQYREYDTQVEYNSFSLAAFVKNTGTYTYDPSQEDGCTMGCSDIEVGVIQVSLVGALDSRDYDISYGALYSPAISLSWYTNKQLTKSEGKEWASKQCGRWFDKDNVNDRWRTDLPPCPCTKAQAKADFGRWSAGMECNEDNGKKCTFHGEGVHCVRSQATGSGATSQCCYTPEGDLIHSQDSYQGSTPDRAADSGSPPYKAPGHVPKFSHWIHDVQPYFYCCLWSKNCYKYMKLRKTTECSSYKRPSIAMAYGDTHIETFDDSKYLMNAIGTFVLAQHNKDVTIQGQFIPGIIYKRTTVLSGLSVMTRVGQIPVEIMKATILQSGVYYVCVGGTRINFRQPFMRKQRFKGVTITAYPAQVILQFDIGIGVEVTMIENMFYTMFSFPQSFQTSMGLLGFFNGNKNDDFKPKMGASIEPSSAQLVYEKFVKSYAVTRNMSTFQEFFDQKASNPYLTIPDKSGATTTEKIKRVCSDDEGKIVAECKFEYIISGEKLARLTKRFALRYRGLREKLTETFRSCGRLPLSDAVISTYGTAVGTKVTVTGCRRKCDLSGKTQYTCEKVGRNTYRWSPNVDTKCSDCDTDSSDPKKPDRAKIAGIVIGVIIIVVILVALIIYYVRRKKQTQSGHVKGYVASTDSVVAFRYEKQGEDGATVQCNLDQYTEEEMKDMETAKPLRPDEGRESATGAHTHPPPLQSDI